MFMPISICGYSRRVLGSPEGLWQLTGYKEIKLVFLVLYVENSRSFNSAIACGACGDNRQPLTVWQGLQLLGGDSDTSL